MSQPTASQPKYYSSFEDELDNDPLAFVESVRDHSKSVLNNGLYLQDYYDVLSHINADPTSQLNTFDSLIHELQLTVTRVSTFHYPI